jgi:uncharacterized protein (DUF488 family)
VTAIPIYTIGYGNREIQDFVALLQNYTIEYLVDIRSKPYSRYNRDFSKDALERKLKQNCVRYIFMGDTLGGRPDNPDCYLEDGRVDYSKLRETLLFKQGIARIRTAWEKQLRVALMCSELKPDKCHRGKLIGNILVEQGIDVAHIDEKPENKEPCLRTQQWVNNQLVGEAVQESFLDQKISILDNEKVGLSRKKYTPNGERI